MGNRTPAKLIVLAAAALLGACGPEAGDARALRAGEPVPREWLPSVGTDVGSGRSEPALVWVFRTRDCLTCQSFDYMIRRLQAVYRDSVPLAAVHVGSEAEAGVPEAFFTTRRISVRSSTRISPRDFERRFPKAALPSLLVVRDGQVAWSSALPQGVSTPEQLDSIVQAARQATAPAVGNTAGG